jgi:uncharacterized protein
MPQPPTRFPVIDGFEFAASGAHLHGAWPADAFPRVRGMLYDSQGSVEYDLRGSRDVHGRHGLEMRIRGALRLACRRCLEPVSVAVEEDIRLWLARSQEEIDAMPLTAEGPDGIVASKEMAVRDLVEDELLLALPYAPRHVDCPANGARSPGARQSPFSGLRGMLRGRHRH